MDFKNPFAAHRNVGIPLQQQTWTDEEYSDEDLATIIFQECVFERVRFERTDFEQAIFIKCTFDDCMFDDCKLSDTRWVQCKGSGFTLQNGEFFGVSVSESRLAKIVVRQSGRQVVLSESNIDVLEFEGDGRMQNAITLSGCEVTELLGEDVDWKSSTAVELDFSTCAFRGATFDQCSFVNAVADGVDLSRMQFIACNLYQSDFSRAQIRHAERSIFAECQLEATDFKGAELGGSLFAQSNAPSAVFDGARLENAMFPKATLQGASFEGAFAPKSVWTEADLSNAKLMRLNAAGAIFRNAKLAGAEVEGANFSETDLHGVEEELVGADLRDSRGSIDWRAEREAEARQSP